MQVKKAVNQTALRAPYETQAHPSSYKAPRSGLFKVRGGTWVAPPLYSDLESGVIGKIDIYDLKKARQSKEKKSSQVIVIINRSAEPCGSSLSSLLDEEIERAHRYQHFLSLIVLDREPSPLNKKPFQEIIRFLKENTRKVDIISFYKEDKLALLLPETSKEGALSLAWRLKREIGFHDFSGGVKAKIPLGIACYPTEASSGEELLEKAFLALKEEDKSSLRKKNRGEYHSSIPVEN